MSEGLSEARHGSRGEGSSWDAADHHGKTLPARLVALGGQGLAQRAAREVGLAPSAVHRVVPVVRPPPASKHPGEGREGTDREDIQGKPTTVNKGEAKRFH